MTRRSLRKSINRGFKKLRISRASTQTSKSASKGKEPVRHSPAESSSSAPLMPSEPSLESLESQVTCWPPQLGEKSLDTRIAWQAPKLGEAGPSKWLGRPSHQESIISVEVDGAGNIVERDRRSSLFEAVRIANSSVLGAPCESRKEMQAQRRSVSLMPEPCTVDIAHARIDSLEDATGVASEAVMNALSESAKKTSKPDSDSGSETVTDGDKTPAQDERVKDARASSDGSDAGNLIKGADPWITLTKEAKQQEITRMSAKLADFELKMQPPVLPPLRLQSEDSISPLTPVFPRLECPRPLTNSDSPALLEKACDSHRPSETPSKTEHLVTRKGHIGTAARAEIASQDRCYLTEVAGANWWHKKVREQGSNSRDGLMFKGGRWGLQ